MTAAGWVFMLGSVTFVLALGGYCFYRVSRAPVATDRMHAPLDIDTRDHEGQKQGSDASVTR